MRKIVRFTPLFSLWSYLFYIYKINQIYFFLKKKKSLKTKNYEKISNSSISRSIRCLFQR